MDMGMGMDNMTGPLTDAGMNMSNITVAYDFLQDILNMAPFQPMDQAVAEAFWYGIIIVITIGALVNFTQYLTLKARFFSAHPAAWLLLTPLQTSGSSRKSSPPR